MWTWDCVACGFSTHDEGDCFDHAAETTHPNFDVRERDFRLHVPPPE